MSDRVTWIDMGQLGAGRWIKSSDGRQIAVFYGPNINPHSDDDVATAVRAVNRDHLFEHAIETLRNALELVGKIIGDALPKDDGSREATLASYQNEFLHVLSKIDAAAVEAKIHD